MASDSISPIKDINEAIARHNPFDKPAILKDPEIWAQGFSDAPHLNAEAAAAIFQSLERARSLQVKVTSLAMVGESGTGKTHLIRRARNRLQREDSGLFAYANAHHFQDVNLIRYQFLQILVDSLRRPGAGGVLQCQQLAAAMVNRAIQSFTPSAKAFTPIELVRKLAANTQVKNLAWVNQLTEALFKMQPDISEPDIVRAFVWTLSNAQAPFAMKWLAGRSLGQWKADELGLPNHAHDPAESAAWETAVHVLQLISEYYPLLICFDDLDAAEIGESGLKRERVVASIVKRLWDSLQMASLGCGVVLAIAMTPTTWTEKIKTLPPGIAAYLSGQGEPSELKETLAEEEIVELVTPILGEFYRASNLAPPTPIYPFEVGQLRALGRENLTVRQVWEWCAQNFCPAELDPTEKVERAFEEAIASEISDLGDLEDNSPLAAALYFGFQSAIATVVEGVAIEAVTDSVKPRSANRGYIQFKIIGRHNGEIVKIGVAVLQDATSQSLLAGLKRLTQYKKFDLTSACLVRSPEREIPRHWLAYNSLHRLTAELGGKWVALAAEDIKPLGAIWRIYQYREEYGLGEKEIFEFVQARRIAADNPLIREILRQPGSVMAAEVVEAAEVAGEETDAIASLLDSAEQRDLMRDLS